MGEHSATTHHGTTVSTATNLLTSGPPYARRPRAIPGRSSRYPPLQENFTHGSVSNQAGAPAQLKYYQTVKNTPGGTPRGLVQMKYPGFSHRRTPGMHNKLKNNNILLCDCGNATPSRISAPSITFPQTVEKYYIRVSCGRLQQIQPYDFKSITAIGADYACIPLGGIRWLTQAR